MTDHATHVEALQSEIIRTSTSRCHRPGASVIDAAFVILEDLRILGRARVCDLTAECGLPRTTVYRLLRQLTAVGAVERIGTYYRLGANLLALGQHVTPAQSLRRLAQRPMMQLAATAPVHVNLCAVIGGAPVYLDIYCGPDRLPFRQIAGDPIPASCASARVLTPHADFFVDDGSIINGVSCAAQAIPLGGGEAAAVGIVVALPHLPRALIAPLRATAKRISTLLVTQDTSRERPSRRGITYRQELRLSR